MHRPPRVGQTEREQEALHPLSGEIDPDLSEIDLGIGARHVVPGQVALGRDTFLRRNRPAAGRDEVPHRGVRKRDPELLLKPRADPLGGVPLLARRLQIRPQPLIHRLLVRLHPRRDPHRTLTRLRHRRGQRLTYQTPVHPVLPRQRPDRQLQLPAVPANPVEQLLLGQGHPQHPPSADHIHRSTARPRVGPLRLATTPQCPRTPPPMGPIELASVEPLTPALATSGS